MFRVLRSRYFLFPLVLWQITAFPRTTISENYAINVAECFEEYQRFYANKNASCDWKTREMSDVVVNIKCENSLTINVFQLNETTFVINAEYGPLVTADELIDYTSQSLAALTTENDFPFELLLHLYGVDSAKEFHEKTQTVQKLRLQLNTRGYFYHLTCSLSHDNCSMILRPGNKVQLTKGFFGKMLKLNNLAMWGLKFESLSTDLFVQLLNLTTLQIVCADGSTRNHTYSRKIGSKILEKTPLLEVVQIMRCGIDEVPADMLFNLDRITQLDISQNNLRELPNGFFKNRTELRDVNLHDNKLEFLQSDLFQHLPKLSTLDCSNNRLTTFPSDFAEPHNLLWKVNFRNNLLTTGLTAAMWRNFPRLEEVHFEKNQIKNQELDFLNNKSERSKDLRVYLLENKVRELKTNNISWLNLRKPGRVHFELFDNPLQCYCNPRLNDILNLKFDDDVAHVDCRLWKGYTTSIPLSDTFDEDCKGLRNIDKSQSCPNGCLCHAFPIKMVRAIDCAYTNVFQQHNIIAQGKASFLTVVMDISGNGLHELPVVTNAGYAQVTELIAFNNSLHQVNASNIPPNLSYLDLSRNNLQQLDKDVIKLLSSTSVPKQLRLSQNPWKCDCDLVPLLNFLKNPNKNVIHDLRDIYCDSSNTKLFKLNVANICRATRKIVPSFITGIVALSILLVLVLSALVYFYKNKNAIKVWLYASNMCLRCVTEEELDKNKTYDAFVSYSHKDEHFVTKELVPQLEEGPIRFKLCIHERDWIGGGSIPHQILESVEESRRTIIVVSKNFIKSNWGRTEFYIAHQNSLEDKRLRIIVILYEIEPNEIRNVDEALEAYLKTNTYLKWDDPLFWQKLRYAMPHMTQCRDEREIQKNDVLKCSVHALNETLV